MEEKVRLVKIKFLGNAKYNKYAGMDPVTGEAFRCERGTVVEVSEQKAKQLGHDFPDQWGSEDEEVDVQDAPEAEPEEEVEEEVEEEKPSKKSKKKKGK